jgi:recombinational DNA repair ATPase RecF
MDDALLELILTRLDAVPLGQEPTALLLAACDSEASLTAQLNGAARPTGGIGGDGTADPAEPAGAYLRQVTVSGFRGVGPPATLMVEPGPGLSVIVGRNGSGKSSFAEGLEVLLTGDLKRWEDLSAVWREGWRNLHATGPAEISAEFLLEDAGPTIVRRTWANGAPFSKSAAAVQVTGEKQTGLDRLGWRDDLVTYRPFLSHTELEAFLGKPSQLYDLLSSVLGLEDLVLVEQRLTDARKERESRLTEVDRDLPRLRERLALVDDERAAACLAALSGKTPDVAQARVLATSGTARPADTQLGRLQQLSQLTVPAKEQVQAAVTALGQVAETLAETAGSAAGQADALAGLLRAALDHYRVHGPGSCPVCGRSGGLDEDWRVRTEDAIARLRVQAVAAEQARTVAGEAKTQAWDLFLPTPTALSGPVVGAADPEAARAAWGNWLAHPDEDGPAGLRNLAAHIEKTFEPLTAAVTALSSSAAAELREREDRWAPAAAGVAAWCARAAEARSAARPVSALRAAVTWLRGATDDIRNARLAPLADQARAIWSQLRQESNVDLRAIRLSGSSTQRKANVNVDVDGAPGAALGVMSQGEVNALALSVFLPRATVADSPFRFLVIDDPVQAMDPSKVDGLARVLEGVSQTRQVLVFTHDDRLPEAIRRLDIAAHILEVTRRPGSVVDVRPGLDPVERQLKDAEALCADDVLPENVAARVVPGLCRLAVEAAFTEAIRRAQLRAGRRHAQVEADIEAADKLTKLAALALFGDAAKGGDVLRRLNSWGRSAADTYQAVNKGAHHVYRGSLRDLVTDSRKLTDAIRSRLA